MYWLFFMIENKISRMTSGVLLLVVIGHLSKTNYVNGFYC